ncbi:MAG: diacylglycerol kinase family protein [Lachnospiraceae bacterium]
MKRLLFIYNLHSGKGLIRNHLADIIDTFNKAGYETVVYSTQERADATRLAKELGAQILRSARRDINIVVV